MNSIAGVSKGTVDQNHVAVWRVLHDGASVRGFQNIIFREEGGLINHPTGLALWKLAQKSMLEGVPKRKQLLNTLE